MHTRLFHIAVCIFVLVLFSASIEAAEAPVLQHADTYTGSEAVTGWLMSEKLDGIRGYWTGKKLLTRRGQPIHTITHAWQPVHRFRSMIIPHLGYPIVLQQFTQVVRRIYRPQKAARRILLPR
jgi:hypothetical protein